MRYILFLLLLLTGCSNPKFSCDYNVITATNATEEGDTIFTQNPLSFGFYIDTALIEVKSYNDAVRGVVTMTGSNSEVKSNITGIWNQATGRCVIENISQETITILVCDTTTKCWAYKQAETQKGLDEIIVPLLFKPWELTKENPIQIVNGWRISKDFPL